MKRGLVPTFKYIAGSRMSCRDIMLNNSSQDKFSWADESNVSDWLWEGTWFEGAEKLSKRSLYVHGMACVRPQSPDYKHGAYKSQ